MFDVDPDFPPHSLSLIWCSLKNADADPDQDPGANPRKFKSYNMLWHTYKSFENCRQKVDNNKGSSLYHLYIYTNENLFIEKKKKGKLANLWPSLPYLW